MGDKLLIRAYNVGCGDCIYVRIPEGKDGFHILIDCGKKGDTEKLHEAIKHIEANLLPKGDAAGKTRLDLIVATHRHEDHIKGFDPEWFKNIQVKNIWLSVAMDPTNPQAKKANSLHALATKEMRGLAASGRALSPQVELLTAMYGVSNDTADDFLMKDVPKANGIKPKFVCSGMKAKDVGLKLPAGVEIHVLAPEKDIDRYYFGKEADKKLKGMQDTSASFAANANVVPEATPKNISATDFIVLQSRMLSNGLAFAAKDSSIQNNMSVVLLIEWKGRRLLFVGDAEWEGEFKEGKHNGSWNVMWNQHRETLLKTPIDFLKVGHHGSINATPPTVNTLKKKKPLPGEATSVLHVLDTILPIPKAGKKPTAQAIVSTEREFYNPIPECVVLVDLAKRVSNVRNYGESLKKKGIDPKGIWATPKAKRNNFFGKYEEKFLNDPQPLRTDLEFLLADGKKGFIDVEIEPND